jgi:hypothetical protein
MVHPRLHIYVELIKKEINRLSQLDSADFMDYVRDCNGSFPDMLSFVDYKWQAKLLQPLVDPQAIRMLLHDGSTRHEIDILTCMDEKIRLLLVKDVPKEQQTYILSYLHGLQKLEQRDWDFGILPVLIMTGKLPAQYPSEMKNCVFCKKSYKLWCSVITCDCGVHSFCEDCDKTLGPEGACPLWEESGTQCESNSIRLH